MLLTEYNEKKYMRMFRKEAREEGLKEGREEGMKEGREEGMKEAQLYLLNTMLRNGASAEYLAELTGLPLEEIKKAEQADFHKSPLNSSPRSKKKRKHWLP